MYRLFAHAIEHCGSPPVHPCYMAARAQVGKQMSEFKTKLQQFALCVLSLPCTLSPARSRRFTGYRPWRCSCFRLCECLDCGGRPSSSSPVTLSPVTLRSWSPASTQKLCRRTRSSAAIFRGCATLWGSTHLRVSGLPPRAIPKKAPHLHFHFAPWGPYPMLMSLDVVLSLLSPMLLTMSQRRRASGQSCLEWATSTTRCGAAILLRGGCWIRWLMDLLFAAWSPNHRCLPRDTTAKRRIDKHDRYVAQHAQVPSSGH